MSSKKISPKAIAMIAIGVLVILSFALAFIGVGAKSCAKKQLDADFERMLSEYTEEPFKEFVFPSDGLAALIPVPKSNMGRNLHDSSGRFSLTVANTSQKDFADYIEQCKEKGFTVDYSKSDTSYSAYNEERYYLSLHYNAEDQSMDISVREPEKETEPPTEKPTDPPTEAPTQKPAETPKAAENKQPAVDQSLIRDNIKEAIDSYEQFIDEYCDFMRNYDASDLTMLSQYMELLEEEVEMSKKFEAIEDEDLTDAEALYYAEVGARCLKKMADAAY